MHLEIEANGTTLALHVEGAGPAVLFIHGYPLDHRIWDPQLNGLEGWRRIAPDLRGFGRSTSPPGVSGLSDYAADLAAVLDALEVERAVVVGLSMGGYIAFECMRQWPERIRGLGLIATRATADTPEGRSARMEAVQLLERSGVEAIAAGMVPKLLAPQSYQHRPGVVAQLEKITGKASAAGIRDALHAMKDRPDSTPMLASLDVPVLVVAGEDDQVMPLDTIRAMAGSAPGARLEIIPGAGHVLTLEAPEQVTGVLQGWLDGISS